MQFLMLTMVVRQPIIQYLHLAHRGKQKTILAARNHYYWPKMEHQIKEMVKRCESCFVFSRTKPDKAMVNENLENPQWESWSMYQQTFLSSRGRNFL